MKRVKLKNDYEIEENIFDPIIPVLYEMVSRIIERKKKENHDKDNKKLLG